MVNPFHLLLVEDEKNLRETLSLNLALEGYHVRSVENGHKALDFVRDSRVDLIVLDVGLPDITGFDVCEALRIRGDAMPIVFLTAHSSTSERVQGLRLGGSDYVAKPFALEELLLRIANLLKSNVSQTLANNTVPFGAAMIDFGSYTATRDAEHSELSKKEIALLRLFLENIGHVVTRENILEKVWGYDVYPSTRTIDNFIVQLRKLVEPDARNPQVIRSVRGVGYLYQPLK